MNCKNIPIALMIFSVCFAAYGGKMSKMEVRYYSFQIEPPGSISAKSISSDLPIISLTQEDELKLRREILTAMRIRNNDFTFQEGRVRLKAVIGDVIYVCDAKGNCMSNKFDMIVINVDRLEKILYKYGSWGKKRS